MTDPETTATQAPVDDADAMGAIFDKLTAEGVEEEPATESEAEAPETEPAEEAEPDAEAEAEAVEEPEPEPEAVEAPSFIPDAVKAHWDKLTPEQRQAIEGAQRDLSSRMTELGRVAKASRPVYDVLVQAAREMPTLANMTPEAIARDVFRMAQVQDQLARDPVNTLLRVAQDYGAVDALRAAVAGQAAPEGAQQTQALVAEIRDLKRQLEAVADPAAIESRVMQTLSARDAERVVTDFAATKEQWSAVENTMPQFVQIAQARLGEGAQAKAVLDLAYDMAINADPDLRKQAVAPAPKAQAPDPERTAAALKAKSVNVVSKSTGKPREMSESQKMAAVWDKYHAS